MNWWQWLLFGGFLTWFVIGAIASGWLWFSQRKTGEEVMPWWMGFIWPILLAFGLLTLL